MQRFRNEAFENNISKMKKYEDSKYNFITSNDHDNSELLEEKIARIKRKNEELKQRHLEVEADKQIAAEKHALVRSTQVSGTMERSTNSNNQKGLKLNMKQDLGRNQSFKQNQPPGRNLQYGRREEFVPKDDTWRKPRDVVKDRPQHYSREYNRVSRLDFDRNKDGPPPDPAYNFLADSERDAPKEETDLPFAKARDADRRTKKENFKTGQAYDINRESQSYSDNTRSKHLQESHGRFNRNQKEANWKEDRTKIDEDSISRQKVSELHWRREQDIENVIDDCDEDEIFNTPAFPDKNITLKVEVSAKGREVILTTPSPQLNEGPEGQINYHDRTLHKSTSEGTKMMLSSVSRKPRGAWGRTAPNLGNRPINHSDGKYLEKEDPVEVSRPHLVNNVTTREIEVNTDLTGDIFPEETIVSDIADVPFPDIEQTILNPNPLLYTAPPADVYQVGTLGNNVYTNMAPQPNPPPHFVTSPYVIPTTQYVVQAHPAGQLYQPQPPQPFIVDKFSTSPQPPMLHVGSPYETVPVYGSPTMEQIIHSTEQMLLQQEPVDEAVINIQKIDFSVPPPNYRPLPVENNTNNNFTHLELKSDQNFKIFSAQNRLEKARNELNSKTLANVAENTQVNTETSPKYQERNLSEGSKKHVESNRKNFESHHGFTEATRGLPNTSSEVRRPRAIVGAHGRNMHSDIRNVPSEVRDENIKFRPKPKHVEPKRMLASLNEEEFVLPNIPPFPGTQFMEMHASEDIAKPPFKGYNRPFTHANMRNEKNFRYDNKSFGRQGHFNQNTPNKVPDSIKPKEPREESYSSSNVTYSGQEPKPRRERFYKEAAKNSGMEESVIRRAQNMHASKKEESSWVRTAVEDPKEKPLPQQEMKLPIQKFNIDKPLPQEEKSSKQSDNVQKTPMVSDTVPKTEEVDPADDDDEFEDDGSWEDVSEDDSSESSAEPQKKTETVQERNERLKKDFPLFPAEDVREKDKREKKLQEEAKANVLKDEKSSTDRELLKLQERIEKLKSSPDVEKDRQNLLVKQEELIKELNEEKQANTEKEIELRRLQGELERKRSMKRLEEEKLSGS